MLSSGIHCTVTQRKIYQTAPQPASHNNNSHWRKSQNPFICKDCVATSSGANYLVSITRTSYPNKSRPITTLNSSIKSITYFRGWAMWAASTRRKQATLLWFHALSLRYTVSHNHTAQSLLPLFSTTMNATPHWQANNSSNYLDNRDASNLSLCLV